MRLAAEVHDPDGLAVIAGGWGPDTGGFSVQAFTPEERNSPTELFGVPLGRPRRWLSPRVDDPKKHSCDLNRHRAGHLQTSLWRRELPVC